MADLDRPSVARVYDYLLGGTSNTAADREIAGEILAALPWMRRAAQANRAFLRRAVTYLSERDIDQFLDLGSGIPASGNVHEVARDLDPSSRVVYVDIDPVAVEHGTELVADTPGVHVLRADLTDADTVIDQVVAGGHLDLNRPVGLLAVAVTHFIPGDEASLLAGYRRVLAPGSYVAITHYTRREEDDPTAYQAVGDAYARTSSPGVDRTREQIRRLFTGTELVPPGLVPVAAWHPDPGTDPDDPTTRAIIGGVGHLAREPV
jgi:hypothetical protein